MNKKIIALFLALLMASPILASCGNDSKNPTPSSGNEKQTGTSGSDGEFAEIDSYVQELAEVSGGYDGKTFTILTREGEFPVNDTVTGDLREDALYNRNRRIEELFGIKMQASLTTGEGYEDGSTSLEMADKLFKDALANTGDYDLSIGNSGYGGATMITNGTIRSINDIDIFDFEKSWWLNDLLNQFSIGEKTYFLAGKITASFYGEGAAILFNKEIAEQYNIEDLYTVVNNGEWTIDKMNEVASVIPTNGDIFRYYASSGLSTYMSAGNKISEKDSEDYPTIPNALTDPQDKFIRNLYTFLGDKTQNIYIAPNVIDKNPESKYTAEDAWDDNKFFLWITGIGHAADVIEKETDFGIIPMPKADVSQPDYIAFTDSVNAAYIPKVLQDEEMTAYIVEAMAALSEKYLEPAYYEKLLKGRSASDANARHMLDIIYSSKRYDLAGIYRWGSIAEIIGDSAIENADQLSSNYRANVRIANMEIKNMLTKD